MMLGKRSRPPMKRTTSMAEFTLDLNTVEVGPQQPLDHLKAVGDQRPSAWARNSNRRNSADFIETAPFLKACFLCKRRLIPGRDIYMYRGDSAFCSLECRQRQITHDERREKCSLTSKKESVTNISGVANNISGKGETITTAV